jgi:hypothetical protein
VNVKIHENSCYVEREPGDPRMKPVGWSHYPNGYCNGPESMLLYHVKQELQKQGLDVIKKRMWKDGHLVDEHVQYVRTRNVNAEHGIMVWNGNHQIYDAGDEFNEQGHVTLHVDRW